MMTWLVIIKLVDETEGLAGVMVFTDAGSVAGVSSATSFDEGCSRCSIVCDS